jgi:hypothetical protein
MLTVVMLSAAMPNAVMLSVGAPHKGSPLLSLQKYYIIRQYFGIRASIFPEPVLPRDFICFVSLFSPQLLSKLNF